MPSGALLCTRGDTSPKRLGLSLTGSSSPVAGRSPDRYSHLTDAMHHGPDQENEDDRKIVRLTNRDVDDAKRLLALIVNDEAASVDAAFGEAASSHQELPRSALTARARELLAHRQKRTRWFGEAMFGEPAWDILLLLYVARAGQRHTITSVSEAANVSKSTAIRWVGYLAHHQLIRRDPHPIDKRMSFLELTEKAVGALEQYLSDTLPTRS